MNPDRRMLLSNFRLQVNLNTKRFKMIPKDDNCKSEIEHAIVNRKSCSIVNFKQSLNPLPEKKPTFLTVLNYPKKMMLTLIKSLVYL